MLHLIKGMLKCFFFFCWVSPKVRAFGALEKKCCFSEGVRPQSELFVFNKRTGVFFWKVSPALGAFGAHGRVQMILFAARCHTSPVLIKIAGRLTMQN